MFVISKFGLFPPDHAGRHTPPAREPRALKAVRSLDGNSSIVNNDCGRESGGVINGGLPHQRTQETLYLVFCSFCFPLLVC